MVMVVMVVMGCNSGGVAGGEGAAGGGGSGAKSLSEVLLEVGRSAENVFYSFLELVSGSLGFVVKATTKKNEVGDYFDGLGKKLEIASAELEKVAEKASADVDKEGILNKGIRAAVDTAKTTLSTLKGHLESLKGIGDGNVVGEANNAQGAGTAPDDVQLKAIFNGLKGIVEVAEKGGVEKPKAGGTALKVGNNGTDNKDGAKILATSGGNPGVQDAGKAAAILASIRGEEMLGAIVGSEESDAGTGVSNNADGSTSALKFAKGGTVDHVSHSDQSKAAAVGGGIALRALVKTGKLGAGAADGQAGGKEEVQAVGVSAVNKLLVAVEEIIKKTVNNVLKEAKGKIDKARVSQEPVAEVGK
ncbi:variable large family protein [Borrelia hispanica]|uniref:variable large family protein n=1 Tax=Borrelia hispanica TaxID=40835 RepID=UPI000A0633EE|nr:variable large family protein [Borrelia hispanica]